MIRRLCCSPLTPTSRFRPRPSRAPETRVELPFRSLPLTRHGADAGQPRALAHIRSSASWVPRKNVLRQEGEDIVDTLKTMRTEHLEQAHAAYPSGGAHQ